MRVSKSVKIKNKHDPYNYQDNDTKYIIFLNGFATLRLKIIF
jgi:hypothetical protein